MDKKIATLFSEELLKELKATRKGFDNISDFKGENLVLCADYKSVYVTTLKAFEDIRADEYRFISNEQFKEVVAFLDIFSTEVYNKALNIRNIILIANAKREGQDVTDVAPVEMTQFSEGKRRFNDEKVLYVTYNDEEYEIEIYITEKGYITLDDNYGRYEYDPDVLVAIAELARMYKELKVNE